MTQINLSTKQKQTLKHTEEICDCQGGDRVQRDGLGVWD